MKTKDNRPADALRAIGTTGQSAAELRRRAEERLSEKRKSQRSEAGDQRTAEDTARLVHELQVHQIELEMQNEELQQAHAQVETLLAQYTDLYDFAPAGHMTLDREGAIRQVNLAGARLLGVERSRLVNRRFGLYVGEGDRLAFSDFLQRVFASQAKECCEVTLPQEGSQPLIVHIEGTRSEGGQECRAVVLDLTELKRAEEALGVSELRYRRLFESAKDGILILDAETGMIIDVNSFLIEMLGYSHKAFLGKKVWELGSFKDIAASQAHFAEVQAKEYIRYEDTALETADGRRVDVEFISNVYQVDHKKVIQCNIRDVTERKKTEEALRASEELFRSLSVSLPLGILLMDTQGHCTYSNPRSREIFGLTLMETLKHGWLQAVSAEDRDSVAHQWKECRRDGGNLCSEFRLETQNGEAQWVIMRTAPKRVNGGEVSGYVASVWDITERKKDEEKMRRMQTELEQSNRDLQRRNHEVQTFYHTLSHELKTPLTSAREFVSIVIDGLAGPLSETQLEYLGIAKDSCDQLRLYVNDLLDVTRLETGKLSLDFQAVPLAALVERVVEMLAPAAAGKGVSLSCDSQPDLPAVPIDKQRILQVLTNLTTNAIKFTPAGGQIRLSLSEAPSDPECLRVAVRDTGRGIPKDQLDLIFSRLYQVNEGGRSAESRSGLGLGLYICQELVQLHGGRISVESELGQGSTFTFTIPKRHEPATLNVLVVDDEATVRDTLRQLLEKKGYHVTLAGGGAEALGLMRQQRPALVILDLQMPGMDGAETLEQIREEWGEIPVVVHTGYPEGDLMSRALKGAPFTVLAKPCPPEQMLNTVRTLTEESRDRWGTQIQPATKLVKP